MNISHVGGRAMRIGLLAGVAVGWTLLAWGAAADLGIVVAIAAILLTATSLALLKLVFELGGADRERREQIAELQRNVDDAVQDADVERDDRIERVAQAADIALKRIAEADVALKRLVAAHDTTVEAHEMTRSMVDKLGARIPSSISEERLAVLDRHHLERPLLSVAIPSFNRPALLAQCLASFADQISGAFENLVEICIMDDTSSDPETLEVAVAAAERCPNMSVRRQPANVGIEANIVAAARACAGDYVLVFGNDDMLVPGALAVVLDDIGTIGAPVHLYDKTRIGLDGKSREAVPGSVPIDLPPSESHLFPTVLDAARRQGYFSTFGFISQVVFRRESFVAVDAAPYLGLTMYAQVFMLVEAFVDSPVLFRNAPVAFHRSAPPRHKNIEAIGRREATFMSGGEARRAQYFGTTLAAAWQRLIDRSDLDPSRVWDQPENLMTNLPLVPWIVANRRLDPALDSTLDPSVVADAERFLAGFERTGHSGPAA